MQHRRVIGGTIIVFLILTVPLAWLVLSITADARAVGRSFVDALREKKYDDAYAMCSPAIQGFYRKEAFANRITPEALPDSWWWTSSRVSGGRAFLKSTVRTWWGRPGVTVHLERMEGEWRVVYFTAGKGSARIKIQAPRR